MNKQTCIFPLLPVWVESYNTSPLRNRGWTLQERELSVRTVFFVRDQMLWECQKRVATEQFPRPRKRGDNNNRLFFLPSNDVETSVFRWYTMVYHYTERELSFQSDKLPAISGLAEAFEEVTELKGYVAGLWESDLVEGLLWSVRRTFEFSDDAWTSKTYKAPSWSWASVVLPVEWWSKQLVKHWTMHPNPSIKPTILGVEIVPHGSDPRGRILKGALRIECILRSWSGGDGDIVWDNSVHVFDRTDKARLFVMPIYLCPAGMHIRHSLGLIITPSGEENTYWRVGLVYSLPPELFANFKRTVIVLV
jgi:hypothetical protein